uniref:USP domain-containing protein n=1 Tax=Timema tahoe TaxID=61484 RepID=A0A7R9IDL6_9NEOP|nr:unnamed protein product [Timema tahoe]
MVPKTLKSVMFLEIADGAKETIITKLLEEHCTTVEACQSVLELGISWVASSEVAFEVSMGWLILRSLEEKEHSKNIPIKMVEMLMTSNNFQHNRNEIPLLIAWCCKQNFSEDIETLLKQNAINVMCRTAGCSVEAVVMIVTLLREHPICLPVDFPSIMALSEAVVVCLAVTPLPEPKKLKTFYEGVGEVQEFLRYIWMCAGAHVCDELALSALKVLYSAIANTGYFNNLMECVMLDKFVISPALASVLQLIEPHVMSFAVSGIISGDLSEEILSSALNALCMWLLQASCYPSVTHWVLQLFNALESEGRYSLLLGVSENKIDRLFIALQLPVLRDGVAPVVWHMLAASQQKFIFHKIVARIPSVALQLKKEDSESSRHCLQTMLDMCHVLMDRFPGHDSLYQPIVTVIQDCPSYTRGQFLNKNGPVWAISPVLPSPGVSEVSTTGRVGLNNLVNTCYINSVLQALFMTRRFCHEVLDRECDDSQMLLSKLQTLFTLLMYSPRRSLSPTEVLSVSRPSSFVPGHQQDSSEYLTHLLDVLHEQDMLGTLRSPPPTTSPKQDEPENGDMKLDETSITRWTTEEDLSDNNILQRKAHSLADFSNGEDVQGQQLSGSHSDSADSGIQSVGGCDSPQPSPPSVHSIVQQCFGGKMLTTYQCLDCHSESVHTDVFRDIQLSFPDRTHKDEDLELQELIDYFLSPEKLCGENKYWCDKCAGLRDATRSLRVLESPSHLILSLKHFRYNPVSMTRTKLLHKVHYTKQVEIPVLATNQQLQQNETYRLYAAVVHSGKSMDSGHYYTYAQDSSDKWFVFNDDIVTISSLDNLTRWQPPDTPYILFYARPLETLQQEPSSQSSQSTLSLHLQEIVARDTLAFIQERKSEEERRRRQQKQINAASRRQNRWDNDRDDDPPPNCGDGMQLEDQEELHPRPLSLSTPLFRPPKHRNGCLNTPNPRDSPVEYIRPCPSVIVPDTPMMQSTA